MHMSDALLSPSVAFAMCAASGAAIAWSVAKIKKEELSEKKLPIMAVAGAFVFAAQMINFTIPATGSSGHIGGGILLAALLGGAPALLTISAVLVIQCLFFADGGLLARIYADHFAALALCGGIDELRERIVSMTDELKRSLKERSIIVNYGIYPIDDRKMPADMMMDYAAAAKLTVKGNSEKYIGVFDGAD